jgi:hypothetical protein
MQVIRISGKAKQVFKYVELAARYRGNVAIKDLEKPKKQRRIDLNQ